jgi:hypothetical protein
MANSATQKIEGGSGRIGIGWWKKLFRSDNFSLDCDTRATISLFFLSLFFHHVVLSRLGRIRSNLSKLDQMHCLVTDG